MGKLSNWVTEGVRCTKRGAKRNQRQVPVTFAIVAEVLPVVKAAGLKNRQGWLVENSGGGMGGGHWRGVVAAAAATRDGHP